MKTYNTPIKKKKRKGGEKKEGEPKSKKVNKKV
jgi:hypothetical protein